MPARRGRRLALALAVAGAVTAGCGGESGPSASGAAGQPAPAGKLVIAVPRAPTELDPLQANTAVEQLLIRQINEPLAAGLNGPYGDTRRLPGLAARIGHSPDGTIWRLVLREGVRFQDGTPFDARAVLVNVKRWLHDPTAKRLLPDLSAVDAPAPNFVRGDWIHSSREPAERRSW